MSLQKAAANENGEFLDGIGMEASSEGCRGGWESLINLQRSEGRGGQGAPQIWSRARWFPLLL